MKRSFRIRIVWIYPCFASQGSSESKVWAIGGEHVQRGTRPIKARADLLAGDVYETNLEVIPDEQDHELHANITPFPIERSPTDRKARRAIAARLADASKLEIMPTE